jgi:hypothetical protein
MVLVLLILHGSGEGFGGRLAARATRTLRGMLLAHCCSPILKVANTPTNASRVVSATPTSVDASYDPVPTFHVLRQESACASR